MTKTLAESAARAAPHIEVGLVCDPGSSLTGIHGMTDLFGMRTVSRGGAIPEAEPCASATGG